MASHGENDHWRRIILLICIQVTTDFTWSPAEKETFKGNNPTGPLQVNIAIHQGVSVAYKLWFIQRDTKRFRIFKINSLRTEEILV